MENERDAIFQKALDVIFSAPDNRTSAERWTDFAIRIRDEAITAAKAENQCDACGGTGEPISGKPCMCNGTGKMSEAARYLREQLVTAEGREKVLREAVERYGAKENWQCSDDEMCIHDKPELCEINQFDDRRAGGYSIAQAALEAAKEGK